MLARGVSPWTQGGATVPRKHRWHCRFRGWIYRGAGSQGLTPLANNGRPSGAETKTGFGPPAVTDQRSPAIDNYACGTNTSTSTRAGGRSGSGTGGGSVPSPSAFTSRLRNQPSFCTLWWSFR